MVGEKAGANGLTGRGRLRSRLGVEVSGKGDRKAFTFACYFRSRVCVFSMHGARFNLMHCHCIFER